MAETARRLSFDEWEPETLVERVPRRRALTRRPTEPHLRPLPRRGFPIARLPLPPPGSSPRPRRKSVVTGVRVRPSHQPAAFDNSVETRVWPRAVTRILGRAAPLASRVAIRIAK